DLESAKPHLAGFVVRQFSRRASNFRADGRLDEYLQQHGIPGIAGIDTRALVRRLRVRGAMKGVLSSVDLNDKSLVAKAKASPGLVGRDLVREVVPDRHRTWNDKLHELARLDSGAVSGAASDESAVDLHVVALDYGMKWNIARHLAEMGCRVTVLPGTSSAEDILAHKPSGVF